MSLIEIIPEPYRQAFKALFKEALFEALEECIVTPAGTIAPAPANEPDSCDLTGALEYLNANGFTISKGQIYKETSAGTMPFFKFGNKLHFHKSKLLEWAQNRLVNGNAVGYLCANEKKGGSR